MIQGFKYNANKPNGNEESTSVKEWLLNLLLLGLFATILTIIMVVMVYTFKLTSHNTRDGVVYVTTNHNNISNNTID